MNKEIIISELQSLGNPENLTGMKRFGINIEKAFGVKIPVIRSLAKSYKNNHELAQQLWETGYHEARILATLVDNYREVTPEQMEKWVCDFNSWDICDQCCANLFNKTPYAYEKAIEWANRKEEFVKRAGFVMMATLAIHGKAASDEKFEAFLPFIIREAEDDRNFVKKAVNWALRQIGKKNKNLNIKARACSEIIAEQPFKSSKWIAADALRELSDEKIIDKLK